MTEVQTTAELLAELEQKAKAVIDDNLLYGSDCLYDPGFALSDVEKVFAAAANPATILAMTAHITTLTERLEKAEKDAGRLDWMISNKATVQRFPHNGRPTFSVHRIEVGKFQRTEHDSPREAIDAAIAQEADHE